MDFLCYYCLSLAPFAAVRHNSRRLMDGTIRLKATHLQEDGQDFTQPVLVMLVPPSCCGIARNKLFVSSVGTSFYLT